MANTATKIDWDCAATMKHIKEAESVGLILIGAGRNRHHRAYRFNNCKHEQEIATVKVRMEIFKCQQCFQLKLRKRSQNCWVNVDLCWKK